jgi:hypothetical protein
MIDRDIETKEPSRSSLCCDLKKKNRVLGKEYSTNKKARHRATKQSKTRSTTIHILHICAYNMKSNLRPNKDSETMSDYLPPPNQATKITPPVDSPRNQTKRMAKVVTADKRRERDEQTQRVATLVKDNAMWKELQQELAKSKVVSRAGVQEITRKFMQEREAEIDAQAKAKARSRSPRRGSNQLDYGRRSSLSMIAEKGKNMRRALSMNTSNNDQVAPKSQIHQNLNERRDSSFFEADITPIDDQEAPKSQRLQNLSDRVNSSFSKMNISMRKLNVESAPRLPVRKRFFPASSKSREKDDMVDELDQAASRSKRVPDLQEASLSSKSCDGSSKGGDGELLELFPSQPRRRKCEGPKYLQNIPFFP